MNKKEICKKIEEEFSKKEVVNKLGKKLKIKKSDSWNKIINKILKSSMSAKELEALFFKKKIREYLKFLPSPINKVNNTKALFTGLFLILTLLSVLTHGFQNFGLGLTIWTKNNGSVAQEIAYVNIIQLLDSDCDVCYDLSIHTKVLENSGVSVGNITKVDMNSEKGRELINKYNITSVPTVIFSPELKNNYTSVFEFYTQFGDLGSDDYYVFRANSAIDAPYEVLENGEVIELIEPGKVKTGVNQTKLYLFLMAKCPYSEAYEKNILPELKNKFPDLSWEVHIVTFDNSTASRYYCEGNVCAMHGEQELKDNKDMICALQQNAWYDWTQCYLNDNKTREDCINDIILNQTMFNDCVINDAAVLLENEHEVMDEFSAYGTPFVFINYDGVARLSNARWLDFVQENNTYKRVFDADAVINEICDLTNNTINGC